MAASLRIRGHQHLPSAATLRDGERDGGDDARDGRAAAVPWGDQIECERHRHAADGADHGPSRTDARPEADSSPLMTTASMSRLAESSTMLALKCLWNRKYPDAEGRPSRPRLCLEAPATSEFGLSIMARLLPASPATVDTSRNRQRPQRSSASCADHAEGVDVEHEVDEADVDEVRRAEPPPLAAEERIAADGPELDERADVLAVGVGHAAGPAFPGDGEAKEERRRCSPA